MSAGWRLINVRKCRRTHNRRGPADFRDRMGGQRVEILICYMAFTFLGAIIAGAKGRSAIGFFLLGLFLSPLISIIAALVVKPNQKALEREAMWKGESRKCPFCAELVRAEAIVCRYCSNELPPLPPRPAPVQPRRAPPAGMRWKA